MLDPLETSSSGEANSLSFIKVVEEPPLAMGIFRVSDSYRQTQPPDSGATVAVDMEVVSVTKIDSTDKEAFK